MSFIVTKIIDGDTFEVKPSWKWNNQAGSIIRANGYDTPEKGQPGYEEAKERLKKIIQDNEIELKNPLRITYGRLLCDVYFNRKNISSYFEEYR